MSSNFVDKLIGKMSLGTGNFYMYKKKVIIFPLMMQDYIIAVSVCGVKTMKMNNYKNKRTNKMGL